MNARKLLVVIDPSTDDQLALGRAVHLALGTQSELHLFCCTYLNDEEMSVFSSRKDAKHTQLTNTKAWLEELAEPVRAQGLVVQCEVTWNQKWETMVSQAAGRIGANLIVKTSFKHSRLERALSRTSDVYIMRTAPCPVLLVKAEEPWQNGIVLAAVCLSANEPDHEPLNNVIISRARRLAQATNSELHLVSAVEKTPELIQMFQWMEEPEAEPKELVSRRFGIPSHFIHIVEGAPKNALPDTVQALHADLLVMGTAARTGLAATLLGNTAEKVLDQLDVDLLCISK